ncbi:MAG: hypothetical protein J6X53_07375 [Abditibacteriota bacterium]|nr:hypothetical protein [Abditibacteriota bacterium]
MAGPKYSKAIGAIVYEPRSTSWTPDRLYTPPPKSLTRMVAKIENEKLRAMLELRLAWLTEFDYAKVADYYAYQATPEEQRVFEALGLVLLDRDGLIMNGFANLLAEAVGDDE